MLRLLRYVSLRHLMATPLRTALTVAGIAVGVAVTVAIAAVNRSIMESFRSTIDTVAGKAELVVTGGAAGFPEEILDQVRAVDGVKAASGSVAQVVRTPINGGDSLFVLGVDLGDDGYFREYRPRGDGPDIGDPLAFLNAPDALLLSERFAAEHGLNVGDGIELQTTEGASRFTVRGLLEDDGPAKAFGGAFAVMDLFAAQAAFGRDRKFDRIDVAAVDSGRIDELKQTLQEALPLYEVERPERRGGSVEQMLLSFRMALNLGSAVALLVGIFLVYNTVSISALQRRREIGTLRALGTSANAIRVLFSAEAAIFGAVGTLAGLPFGWLVAQLAIRISAESISSLYVHIRASEVTLTVVDIAIGATLGIVGSILAALRPASQGASVQPVEALRRDVAAGAGLAKVRSLPTAAGILALLAIWPASHLPNELENFSTGGFIGMLCVLLGATLLSPLLLKWSRRIFVAPASSAGGIAGRLAADNFARAPGRTAVPVSALAIGVAMTVCIGGFVGSFKKAADRWISHSIPADLFLTSGNKLAGVRNTPMGTQLGDELEKLEGVRAVDRLRFAHIEFQGLYVYLLSLQPETYFSRSQPIFLAGDPSQAERALAEGAVLITENLSKRRRLTAGDTLELRTPTGVKRYPVAGVIIDYTSDQGTIAMGRERYIADFQDELVDTYELYLQPGADLQRIRREVLNRWGRQYDLFALSNAELRVEAESLLDQAFSVTYAMELVAVLLALLGVINTLLAAVLDRTRELGLLRAVGATRGQVMATIAIEAALIGVAGGIVGVVAGSTMAWIITDNVGAVATGWTLPFHLPWGLAFQIAGASMLAALLAGLWPAWRAARLDVVDALSYE